MADTLLAVCCAVPTHGRRATVQIERISALTPLSKWMAKVKYPVAALFLALALLHSTVAGARGLMPMMPFWVGNIGAQDHNLFDVRTNTRFGCLILRHYPLGPVLALNQAMPYQGNHERDKSRSC
jgi:hypothetical protein